MLRHRHFLLLLLFLLALTLRLRAFASPSFDPDAIRFIAMAQQLATDPLAAIRLESYHPLQSILGLAFHSLTKLFIANDRIAWLAALQLPGILAGSLLSLQIISLARSLGAPFKFAYLAGLIWALNMPNYGPDALSDMLALSLLAASFQLGFRALRHLVVSPLRRFAPLFFAAGLLSALAYLTRPEGLFASLLFTIFLLWKLLAVSPPRRFAVSVSLVLILLGTAIPATPYMLSIHGLTQKKQILTASTLPSTHPRTPYAAVAATIRESRRALGIGSFIILLSAIPIARSRLLGRGARAKNLRPLILLWLLIWPLIDIWLYLNAGYLDPRHTFPLQLLLHSMLALALFEWTNLFRNHPHPRLAKSLATVIPLLIILIPSQLPLLRSTTAPEGYHSLVLPAANWIATSTPPDTIVYDRARLVSYYANRSFPAWQNYPNAPEPDPTHPTILTLISRANLHETPPQEIGPYLPTLTLTAPNNDTLTLYSVPSQK